MSVVIHLSAKEALSIWQKKGTINADQAAKLEAALEGEDAHDGIGKGIVIFATIGAILIGLGVLLFIGSNWQNMGPSQRILTIFAGYIVATLSAYICESRGFERVAESLWFLCSLLLGASIFLLAQIFHYSLTFWQGPFLWMVGVLVMGWARRQSVYAYLAVPLGLLALGWLGGGKGWFMDDQMQFLVDEEGLRSFLPLIGVGLIALGTMVRNGIEWAEESLFKWGAFLIAVPLIISTAEENMIKEIFEAAFTLKQIFIMLGVFLLIIFAVMKGKMRSDLSRYALILVTILLLIPTIHVGGDSFIGEVISKSTPAFVVHILLVFGLTLLSIWFGVQSANRHLVNAGILSSSVIIIIQYFSWTFDMLHSSMAFIIGGIVLIGLSVFMERTRRKLLASIATS
ncbi:DUF2157 domain-containing protein [Patescibacteria group bacterium]|nr:DUF2157 domain-containing protein [Patescibacteria group bacterium]MBU1123242.1 DUF2157 domain-containing protein [Patescibacteria group bacterium]MBU1911619.1 DUF2157 domain-containing protein [Patescibacteria group bacterium]